MNASETAVGPEAKRPAGEMRSLRRRRIFAATFVFSLLLGVAVSVSLGMAEDGGPRLTLESAWGLAAAAAPLIAGFSVWFYRGFDEVEVQNTSGPTPSAFTSPASSALPGPSWTTVAMPVG